MKKSLSGVVVLLAGAFVAHSQGVGTVGFGNYGSFSSGSYMYVTLNGTKIGSATANTGTPTGSPTANIANGDDWTVELYGAAGTGDAASTLLPLIDGSILNNTTIPVMANLADGTADGNVGTWYSGGYGNVPGTTGPANGATVQVYAWYNDGGTITSYSAAVAANTATPGSAPNGFSATGNVPSLGGGSPPIPAASLPTGMGNIALTGVPEPSTIALGVMGASAFLMRLRKKQ
jgi:hypothetical protein